MRPSLGASLSAVWCPRRAPTASGLNGARPRFGAGSPPHRSRSAIYVFIVPIPAFTMTDLSVRTIRAMALSKVDGLLRLSRGGRAQHYTEDRDREQARKDSLATPHELGLLTMGRRFPAVRPPHRRVPCYRSGSGGAAALPRGPP